MLLSMEFRSAGVPPSTIPVFPRKFSAMSCASNRAALCSSSGHELAAATLSGPSTMALSSWNSGWSSPTQIRSISRDLQASGGPRGSCAT